MMNLAGYSCIRCSAPFPADIRIDSKGCPYCAAEAAANLQVVYDHRRQSSPATASEAPLPSLWRYADRLPCQMHNAVSLGEGLTPLLPAARLGARLGVSRLFIKDEGGNPTWSHKDRFSTVAVSAARLSGAKVVATASSGNAGASLAAYAAAAGLRCVVVTFASTATAMLAQIRKYGATVIALADKSQRWPLLAEGIERFGWFATSPFHAPVVGSHPAGIEGYKTLAYEIVEQMHGVPPDWCVLPVCYGDALSGIWLGFKELSDQRVIDRLPRLVAAEVHGSLERAMRTTKDAVADAPAVFDTVAVSIGTTRSAFQALKALRESQGVAVTVGNSGLIELQAEVAAMEGVFAELASITPFAAIASLRQRELIKSSDSVVAIATASGLKDLDRSVRHSQPAPVFLSAADAMNHLQRREETCVVAPEEA